MRKTPTIRMWDALEEQLKEPTEGRLRVFPKQFLVSLRLALESGLTCQQITSMIILQSSLNDLSYRFHGDSLVERTKGIVEVIEKEIKCQGDGQTTKRKNFGH